MDKKNTPLPIKWPFLLGDGLMVLLAVIIIISGPYPFVSWQLILAACCTAFGAILAIVPFILQHNAELKLLEIEGLTTASEQIKKVEEIGFQITNAANLWISAQDISKKSIKTAEEVAAKMSVESRKFIEALEKANDAERARLKLEVEKLHRAEADWLQVVMHILDHVFALHQAALRSGQPHLIEQITLFQRACYDAARRVGVLPFIATPSEPFNSEIHQPENPPAANVQEPKVEFTRAQGFSYQGQLVRKALVVIASEKPTTSEPDQIQPSIDQQQESVKSAETEKAESNQPEPVEPPPENAAQLTQEPSLESESNELVGSTPTDQPSVEAETPSPEENISETQKTEEPQTSEQKQFTTESEPLETLETTKAQDTVIPELQLETPESETPLPTQEKSEETKTEPVEPVSEHTPEPQQLPLVDEIQTPVQEQLQLSQEETPMVTSDSQKTAEPLLDQETQETRAEEQPVQAETSATQNVQFEIPLQQQTSEISATQTTEPAKEIPQPKKRRKKKKHDNPANGTTDQPLSL